MASHHLNPPYTEGEDKQIREAADLRLLARKLKRKYSSVVGRASYLRLMADPKRHEARKARINAKRRGERGPEPTGRIRGDGTVHHKIAPPPPPAAKIVPHLARPSWFEESVNPRAGR